MAENHRQPRTVRIDLFCEDRGHELFVGALVERLAADEAVRPVIRPRSSRGGHGRAVREFGAWQRSVSRDVSQPAPDLLVLVIDANCKGWNPMHRELEEEVDGAVFSRWVVACPDPHLERWFLADPAAFTEVIGAQCPADPGKCDRLFYKQAVEKAVREAELPLLTGIGELGPDLVRAMDLFPAGKSQPSLGKFVEELRGALRQLSR